MAGYKSSSCTCRRHFLYLFSLTFRASFSGRNAGSVEALVIGRFKTIHTVPFFKFLLYAAIFSIFSRLQTARSCSQRNAGSVEALVIGRFKTIHTAPFFKFLLYAAIFSIFSRLQTARSCSQRNAERLIELVSGCFKTIHKVPFFKFFGISRHFLDFFFLAYVLRGLVLKGMLKAWCL